MKLIDLKLKGFIGIKKGMGLDELTLPLADLTGLVAFDGPNGRGKTTVLENMQPFRQFASRRGGLKRHCFAKDSQKELTFEYNGDTIRTLIKMDAQTTRSDEGFIWVNDKPMVDGKVTSYDGMIKEIFGSSNLFFWSIFCAQNSKRLTDLTTGKMKELFTEFLRLDRYAVYEDTVKQAINLVAGISAGVADNALRLDSELQKYAGIRPMEIIETEGNNLQVNQATFEDNEGQIELIQKGVEDARAEIAANEEKAKQRKALGLDLVAAKHEHTDVEKEKADKQSAIGEKMGQLNDEIKTIHYRLEGAERIKQAADRCFVIDTQSKALSVELDTSYKARENMQAERENLNYAVVERMRVFDDCIHSELVKKAEDKLAGLRERLKEVQEKAIAKDPTHIAMTVEIEGLIRRSVALSQKDKDCVSESCGLILDALTAEKELTKKRGLCGEYIAGWHEGHNSSIDEIQVKLSEAISHHAGLSSAADAEIKEAENNLAAAKAKVQIIDDDLEPLNVSITLGLAKKQNLAREFAELSEDASQRNALDIATVRLSELEKTEADLKLDLAGLEKEYGAKLENAQAKIDKIAERMAEIRVNENAEAELQKLVAGLGGLKANQERVKHWINASEQKILDATRIKETVEGLQKEFEIVLNNQSIITAEATEWQYLKEACGKKGLQALEIDGVSPVIEAYANDLLISTFGPMNTIRFETQDQDGKEVLNIVVMDPDGTETMLENKSGGESVWILKALRLALTLLSKEKSGRAFQTVLMDEEDGALSPANAVKFISLYRSMMNLGGFDDCFYISHKQEAVALANHRLIFGDNGVQID